MVENGECAIWQTPAFVWPTPAFVGLQQPIGRPVDSSRAGGRYVIGLRAAAVLDSYDENLKPRLTSWLIEQRQLGTDWPQISVTTLDHIRQRRNLSIHRRADNLLRYIQQRLPHIGSDFYFETDAATLGDLQKPEPRRAYMEMLAWSESTEIEELLFLLDYLKSTSRIQQESYGATCFKYRPTVLGYSHLDEIDHTVADSSQAFVAMWFDPSMDEVWETGFNPAISDAGYRAVRIDQKEHLNKIDDEIIAEIRRSRFLVADFTGARGGVYYEAGFAHGLNIPVVFTCRQDAMDDLHFDTRQYSHLVWETPQELRVALAKRVSAVLGDGPLRR